MGVDIERYLEGAFVQSLREIYRQDTEFVYNDDDKQSQIIISSGYPNKDSSFKIPQILVLNVNYQFNESCLSNNFACDIIEETANVGSYYANQIPYSVTIACIAPRDAISRNLANRTVNFISFDAREIFEDIFKLNIKGISKTGGGIDKNLGEDSFSNIISVSGVIIWNGSKRDTVNANVINNIKLAIVNKMNVSEV